MAKKDTIWAVLEGRPTDRFVHPEDCVMVFTPGERNVGGDKQPDGTTIDRTRAPQPHRRAHHHPGHPEAGRLGRLCTGRPHT